MAAQRPQLTKQHTIEETFSVIDKDGDGKITVEELAQLFNTLHYEVSIEEASEIINNLDTNSDGMLDIDEWTSIMRSTISDKPDVYHKQLKAAFNRIDTDEDGTISKTELAYVMQTLGENLTAEDMEALMVDIDLNSNGKIDFDEFVKLMVGDRAEPEEQRDI